jgi:hypothetical protein
VAAARVRCRYASPFHHLPETQATPEDAMNINRQLTSLFAALLAFAGLASAAQAQGYDPYYPRDDQRYDDRYDSRYDNRYDDRYGGRVRCESRERRTIYCNVDTRGGVRLVHQLSDHRCVRGSNWGANERGIWVTDGCRAEFELGTDSRHGYGGTFRCESTDNRTRYCNVDTRYGVSLVRQLSRSACIEGRSWGATREGVWVSRGCRAEFSTDDRYTSDRMRYRY